MLGFLVFVLFYYAGVLLNHWLDIPLPGNVIGLVLLTAAMYLKLIKLEWVEKTGELMLRHMLLFFAPVVVGVMVFFPLIGRQWLPLGLGLIGSTLAVLLAAGATVQVLSNRREDESREFGRE